MSFIDDIKLGLVNYSKALKFIRENRLRKFFLVPILVNILFALAIAQFIGYVEDYFWNCLDIENRDFLFSEYLGSVLKIIVWVLFKIFFFFVFAYFGGYIVLMIMSPVLAYLSERTEEITLGTHYPFNFSQTLKDVVRGVLIALRNMFIELGFTILMFFFSMIPIVGFLSPVILFIISAYFYGFSFMDYNNERRKMTVKESVSFIRDRKGAAIANGGIFALFMLIPYVGVTLAGFTAIVSVVSASLTMNSLYNKNKQIE